MKNMMMNLIKPTLIVIAGPTASGKTNIAIDVAQILNCDIISADSRQFYKELKIGTAIPTPEQLQTVKHHFVGNLSIHDSYNISKYENEVIHTLESIFKQKPFAIICGGSGLYIDAVLNGVDFFPDIDNEVRDKLKKDMQLHGLEYLTQQLKDIDIDSYNTIELSNPVRVIRALEVFYTIGVKFSQMKNNIPKKRMFNVIKFYINIERNELYRRINNRTDTMIQDGLLDEAKKLYNFRNLTALNTLGYKELFEHINNKVTLEQAITNIKTNTRRYAKRQITWFKRYSDYIHLSYPDISKQIIERINYQAIE